MQHRRMLVYHRTLQHSNLHRSISTNHNIYVTVCYQFIFHFFTWNTVSSAWTKLSKFERGLSIVLLKLNFPPKTCIPNNAKITINKNRSNNRDAIDWIEFNRDATKFDSDCQYLEETRIVKMLSVQMFKMPYFVTLNTLSKRTQRSTDTPNGGIILVVFRTISAILPITTKQSNLLNNETK